jgi:UDP-glucose 4-epimerase
VKVLVTGGAGYIGSHLSRELHHLGANCYVIDNFSRGREERITTEVNFEKIDLCDQSSIQSYFRGRNFDAVFHLAGYMQARESSRIPNAYWANNLLATQNLLACIRDFESTKFIFSSSCSVYGSNESAIESSPLNPLSVYAKTKVEAEKEVKQAFKDAQHNFTIFRFFNVIGCIDSPFYCDMQNETLLPSAARLLLRGERPIIYGNDFNTSDGFAVRDFIDVRDLVRALVLPLNFDLSGTYNLASGQSTSIRSLLQILLEVSNSSIKEVEIRDRNPEDPSVIKSMTSQRIADLGWSQEHALKDSIENFWTVFNDSNGN